MIHTPIFVHPRFMNGTDSEKIVSISSGSPHEGLPPVHQKKRKGGTSLHSVSSLILDY